MNLTADNSGVEDAVTLAQAKAHLIVEHNEDDAYIQTLTQAATAHIETEVCGPVMKRPYTWKLDCWPSTGGFCLPRHPVLAITDIKYIDVDGVEQTLAPANYELIVSDGALRSVVRPAYNTDWPALSDGYNRVTITFDAGYDSAPKAIQQGILLIVGSLYRDREESTTKPSNKVAVAAENLVRQFKQYA